MLAYAPLHALLFGLPGDEPGPPILVMTSGNLGGEPICFTDDDARDTAFAPRRRLADARPGDPGAVRRLRGSGACDGDRELPIRRSRGYAPLPVALPVSVPPTLAVGADLKNTLGRRRGQVRVAEPAHRRHGRPRHAVGLRLGRSAPGALTGVDPEIVVADAHPRYRSTAWAHRNADGRPVRHVQHHHAHVAAVMAEHGLDGSRARARVRLRRHRLRSRRRGLGWRGAARRLQGLSAGWPT